MENQMSLIEIALEIMESSTSPLNIYTLIEETLKKKGIVDEDGSIAAKLYTDITISSKFVYMGDDLWDLKSRQSLEVFDKDGSSFINPDEEYSDKDEEDLDENEDDLDEDEEDLEDEDEDDEESDDEDEDDEESDDHYEDEENYDDEESDEDDLDDEDNSYDDEDKYNKIMDDYEDLYED